MPWALQLIATPLFHQLDPSYNDSLASEFLITHQLLVFAWRCLSIVSSISSASAAPKLHIVLKPITRFKTLSEACCNKALVTVANSHSGVFQQRPPLPWRLYDSNRLSNSFVYRSHWHTTSTRDTSRSRPCSRVHHSQLFSPWVTVCCYSSIIQTLRCRVTCLLT